MILIAILVVGLAFLLAEYRNRQGQSDSKDTTLAVTTNDENSLNQTNWKQILLANDPASSTNIKDITNKPEKLTQIDMLGRDLFSRYMELKQAGISGDKGNQQDLAQEEVNKIILTQPKQYTLDEITVKSDSSIDSVKLYGDIVGGIFKKYTIHSRNEAVIAKDASDKNNPDILKELDPVISSYQNIVDNLVKTAVPQSMESLHLNLVNAMNTALFVSQSLRKSGVDPISGIQGVAQYQSAQTKLSSAFLAIRNYFLGINLKYPSTEAGFIFTKSS